MSNVKNYRDIHTSILKNTKKSINQRYFVIIVSIS